MKHLFKGPKEEWTEDGHALANEARECLRPLFNKYSAKDYGYRDISHVIQTALMEEELMALVCYRKDFKPQEATSK